MKNFILNLVSAANIAAVVAIGVLAGGCLEAGYNALSGNLGLSIPGAQMRGCITSLTAIVVVLGAGMAYMERH